MPLRVTLQTSVTRALASTRVQTDALARLQQQAQTGNRILAVSDDPFDAVAALATRAQDGRLTTYLGNISQARTSLENSSSGLREAGEVLSRARQLAIDGAQAGNTSAAYEGLAQEADALLTRLLNVANSQQNGQYVFGGTATRTPPFAVAARDAQGRPAAVAYQGAQEEADVSVSPQLAVATGYVGSRIFQVRQRGPSTYSGETGATAGTAVDSATGEATLQVRHAATTYAPGSGIQPGTDSANGDTILGPSGAHTLTVTDTSGTGASGTIALNGGPLIPFTSTDANLRVGGPLGEVVFVDTRAITPGFSGTVAAGASGTLSTDGGATAVTIDFSTNQVVTNSSTGGVTNVNTTNVRRTGDAQVEYTGAYDAFQILAALRDDLRNVRGLAPGAQATSLAARLSELERVHGGVLQTLGQQAADLQNLDGLQTRLEDVQIETRKLTGDLEGADLTEVVINLQSQQSLLELTLASTARVFDQNLLDFLR